MPLYNKVNMKDLLSEGLYLLVLEKPFEKITVKQICDKTGVIRGTFYNHFMDKYDALEYLTNRLIIEGFDQSDDGDLAKHIIQVFYDKKEFFTHAFTITGQNSFASMLEHIFTSAYTSVFDRHDVDFSKVPVTKDYLARYLASSTIFIFRDWTKHNFQQSPEEIYKTFQFLCSYSLTDIVYENTHNN